MRNEQSRVLGALAGPSGPARNHRSLGFDEDRIIAAATDAARNSRARAGPAARKSVAEAASKAGGAGKGWNTSTRASPVWKKKANKENIKGPAPKPYNNVPSKLTAPMFTQRRSGPPHAPQAAAAGEGVAAAPLHNSSAANGAVAPRGGGTLPLSSSCDADAWLNAEAPFVTTRRGSMPGSPIKHMLLADAGSGAMLLDAAIQEESDSPPSPDSPPAPAAPHGDGEALLDEGELLETAQEAPCEQPAAEFLSAPADLLRSPSVLSCGSAPQVSRHPSVVALYQYASEVRTPTSRTPERTPSSTPQECVDLVLALEGAAGAVPAEEAIGEDLTDSFETWLASMGMEGEARPADVVLRNMRALWERAKEAQHLELVVTQLKESELQLAQHEAEDSARHVGLLLAENESLQDATVRLQAQLQEVEERLQLAAAARGELEHCEGEAPGSPTPQSAHASSPGGSYTAFSPSLLASNGASPAQATPQPPSPAASLSFDSTSRAGLPLAEGACIEQCVDAFIAVDSPSDATSTRGPADAFAFSAVLAVEADGPMAQLPQPGPPEATVETASPQLSSALSLASQLPQPVAFAAWAVALQPTVAATPSPAPSVAGPSPSPNPPSALSTGLSLISTCAVPVAFAEWRREQEVELQAAHAAGAAGTNDGAATADRGAAESPTATLRSNPLYDADSAAPSMANTPLPQRTNSVDALEPIACAQLAERAADSGTASNVEELNLCASTASPIPSEAEASTPARATPAAAAEEDVSPQARAASEPSLSSCPTPATPVADGTAAEPPSGSNSAAKAGEASVGRSEGGAQYPNTPPSAAWPASPVSIYATPLEAFATPASMASLYNAAVQLSALRLFGSVTAHGGDAASEAATPASFSFGMLPTAGDGATAQTTPAVGVPAPGGLAAAGHALGSPLPLQLTPVQMRIVDELAAHAMQAMSPYASPMGATVSAGVAQPEAAAPVTGAAAGGFSFEHLLAQLQSPLPLPAHVSHARRCVASGAPVAAQQQQHTPEEATHTSPMGATVSAAVAQPKGTAGAPAGGFSFEHLLAQLQSPLPLPAHLSHARRAAAAGAAVAAQQQPQHSPEEAAPACTEVPSSVAQPDVPPATLPAADAHDVAVAMSAFAQLMSFLHGHPVGSAGAAAAAQAQAGGAAPAVPAQATGAAAPAAACTFANLLEHLHSPLPGGPAARLQAAAPGAAVPLGLALLPFIPAFPPSLHDSPATSEASNFGFSTAAKQVSVRTTPATVTPGGGISFQRWPQGAAASTFGLDSRLQSGGRSRLSPMAPVSFSFGMLGGAQDAPGSCEHTPAMARAQGGYGLASMASPMGSLLEASLAPQPPASGDAAVQTPTNAELRTCVPHALEAAAEGRNIASFSFGAGVPAATTPHFRSAAIPAAASPAVSFSFEPLGGGSRQPAIGTPVSLPLRADGGSSSGGGISNANAALPPASPALSLGAWGFHAAGAGAPAVDGSSPAHSVLSFAFGGGGACALGTPVWPHNAALGAAAREEAAASPGMASPTLFGMGQGGLDSPFDTPGVTQAPATAIPAAAPAFAGLPIMWAALLGNLRSPMPATVAGARAGLATGVPQFQLPQPAAPHEHAAGQESPSLDAMPAASCAGAAVAADSSPTRPAASCASTTSASLEPAAPCSAASLASVASGAPEANRSPPCDAPPPPYEALPHLIAAGLCVSASASIPLAPGSAAASASAPPTGCSSVGENPSPLGHLTMMNAAQLADAAAFLAAAAAAPQADRVFTPARRAPGDAASAIAAPPSLEPLLLESISVSTGSQQRGRHALHAGCTTEPSPCRHALTPGTAVSGMNMSAVHESPVVSFNAMPSPASVSTRAVHVEASSQEAEPGSMVVEPGDVRDTISRSLCNSAVSSPLPAAPAAQAASSAPGVQQAQQAAASCSTGGFPEDAVQRLLFSDTAEQHQVVPDAAQDAAPSTEQAAACTPVRMPQASPDGADTKSVSLSDMQPAAADPRLLLPSPASSARPSVYDGLPSPNCDTPFSNLGGSTLSATPCTLDGAKSGEPKPLAASPMAARGGSTRGAAGQGGASFWAPSAAGPALHAGAQGERVTLEVENRRICANADLLLDFKGSPGRPGGAGMPMASVTGAVAAGAWNPLASGPPAASPRVAPQARKGWAPPPHGAAQQPAVAPKTAAPQALQAADAARLQRASGGATGHVAPPVALAPADGPPTDPHAALRARMLLHPGQGLPVQQLVAASLASVMQAGAAQGVPGLHMPLSHRLGLWLPPPLPTTAPMPFGAAWGVPCGWPAPPAHLAPRPTAAAAAQRQPVQAQQHQQVQPSAAVTPAVALTPVARAPEARPCVQSRDAQTTPSLAAPPVAIDEKVQAPPPAVAAKPPFRSRIPAPGAAAAAQAAAPTAPASADDATEAAESSSSDTESPDLQTPVERVVRRTRLLSAAVGGPQRVPVAEQGAAQRAASRVLGQAGVTAIAALGEEEVRRRAQVLGMRISPYLRPKKQK